MDQLIEGLIYTCHLLDKERFDPVLTATAIAFGFVFIHPFSDGNGRIHRYLIHHILAKLNLTYQGVIFPISASILDKIEDYRIVLESYSHPILELIEWETTPDHNVEVLNDTIDYYRYFDATKQAEFLFNCLIDTILNYTAISCGRIALCFFIYNIINLQFANCKYHYQQKKKHKTKKTPVNIHLQEFVHTL